MKKSLWVTRKVVKLRRAKNKAWKKYKANPTKEFYDKYKIKLKLSNSGNKSAKIKFESKLAEDSKFNSKSFFAYVKSKQRTRERVGPLKKDGLIVTDNKEAANILNEHFTSVFTREDVSCLPKPKIFFNGLVEEELSNIEITADMVGKKLDKLKTDKSPGPDGMHPKLLYEIRDIIKKPLALLFQQSLVEGKLPEDWKSATITPLFKKGSKADPQNYRPVSLTSIVCKIFESVLKDKILEHLEKHSLIRDSQHGFTRGRSCLTNLLDFLEEVTRELDKGNAVDVIYLDFAKAFDKVPHRRLVEKVKSHGIGGKIASWIGEWLSNRKQRVNVGQCLSEWGVVHSGVPQGSVLGPILFLIYINDIDEGLVSKLWKFADDTKMCRSVTDAKDADVIRKDLDKMFLWSKEWQMLFNVDKCSVLHMGKNNKQIEYKLGDKAILTCKQEKDLSIIIESSGKFSQQCLTAVNKANSLVGMIRRSIQYKSKGVIVKLFKSLVRPKLEYCIQAWSPYLRKDIDMIERVQRRALKVVQEFKELSYEERLLRAGLITLEKRRVRGDLIQVFKIVRGFDKLNFNNFFEYSKVSNVRGHSFKFVKNRSRLDIRKNYFSQRVVNAWNKLPQHVVESVSINAFKNSLDKFDKYF
jgi:ribonuclease P/MRP protein subunit RPP40